MRLTNGQRHTQAVRARRFTPLRRALRVPVWADASLRLGAAFALIMAVVLIHWFGRDGLVDHHDGHVTFLDVVYFTMISITTTGFGDIAPISPQARLVEAVIVTPIRVAVLFIFIGAAYSFVIKRGWEKWRMARIQEQLTNHVVVLGYGISGSEAVNELIARGTDPHCIVVMDTDPERLALAEEVGCNVIEADATRDEHLLAVRIDKAQTVLVSAGRDDASILIVLTARHLAPKVPISVVIRASDNELLAHQAGADNVINPVRFTGLLLAGSAQGLHTAEYLADLASVGGRVQLVERTVLPEEIGKPLAELATGGRGLRIYRDALPRKPKGLMFDLDGTLILSDRKLGGYTAIPGAAETLQELDARGIPWIAMTNGSAYAASVQAPKLRAVGLPVRDERLFTPNSVAARAMAERGYERVLVLGTQGVIDALEEAGVPCVGPDDEAAHSAAAVYVAWHPECSMAHIHLACERVLDGAAFLTASDIPYFAARDGRAFGYSCAINGAVARITGREPEPCGKPSALALAMIAEELGIAETDVGVVGDDAKAEMEMARAGGAIGIAVASGSTSRAEWAAQPESRAPHLVIDSVADLLSNGLLG